MEVKQTQPAQINDTVGKRLTVPRAEVTRTLIAELNWLDEQSFRKLAEGISARIETEKRLLQYTNEQRSVFDQKEIFWVERTYSAFVHDHLEPRPGYLRLV